MSGLSIQLNKICVGSSHLDAFAPPHKSRTEECLTKIFDKNVSETPKKEIPLHLRFRPGRSTLLVDNREIPLGESKELKRVDGVVRYYQHAGILPRVSATPVEEEARKAYSKKSVQAVNEASVPGTNGNILAGMRIADDTLSLTRNIMYAIPALGPNDPVANHLGYYAGIFWTFFALRELDDGFIEYKRSKMIGDEEGKKRAESRVLSGSIVSAASLSYLGGKVCDSFISSAAGATLSGVSNILFGAGSLLAMGTTLLGVIRCEQFNRQMKEYLENPALTEKQRMQGTIQFLKDAISVTPEERADIAARIEQNHPDWSKEMKERFLLQKISDLTEVKVKYLKRRTSNRSLRLILEKADPILAKLEDPKRILEGIRDASLLINTIQKDARIKASLYMLGFMAALISFVAMVMMSAMSAGLLPFLLYGIAGAIYLAITVYSIAGLLIKRDDDMKIIEFSPFQTLSHLAAV